MGANNFIFPLNFFKIGDFQLQILHFGQTFSDRQESFATPCCTVCFYWLSLLLYVYAMVQSINLLDDDDDRQE